MIHTFERNPCQPNTIEHCSFAGTTLPTWPAICTFCHNQLLQMHWPSQATNQLIKEAMKKGVILNITFEMFEEAGTAQAEMHFSLVSFSTLGKKTQKLKRLFRYYF